MSDIDDEARAILSRLHRFECPVPWCVGFDLDHGGNDAPPEEWVHTSAYDDLEGLGSGSLTATGGGPVLYWVSIEHEGEHTRAELGQLAERLRDIAAQLDERCLPNFGQ